MKKRLLALLLSLIMVFSAFPFGVMAEGEALPVIVLDRYETVLVRGGDVVEYSFTPEEDGVYAMHDEGRKVFLNAEVYDSEGRYVYHGNNRDQFELKAGETYRVCMIANEMYGGTTGVQDAVSFYWFRCVPATSLTMERTKLKGMVGMRMGASAEWNDKAAVEDVVWTVADPTIVEVFDFYRWTGDSYGVGTKIKFLKEGTTTITVTSESGITASVEVVSVPVVDIALGEEAVTHFPPNVNSEYTPLFRFVPEEDGEYGIFAYETWEGFVDTYNRLLSKFNDPSSTTSADGMLWSDDNRFQLKAGQEYFVCVQGENAYYSMDVQVSVQRLVPATGIDIFEANGLVYEEGQSCYLTATLSPAFSVAGDATWESSNPDVVKIHRTYFEDGVYHAYCEFLKEGEAQITVRTEEGLTDTVTARVTGLPYLQTEVETPFETKASGNRFAYIPEEDGAYNFEGFSADPESDSDYRYASFSVMDSNGEQVAYYYNDYGTEFNSRVYLKGGERYVISIGCSPKKYVVKMSKALSVTSFEISKKPNKTSYVKGYLEDALDLEGLEVKIGYENGDFKTIGYSEFDRSTEAVTYDVNGETGVVTFYCEGKECTLTLTLIESFVARLELISSTAKDLVENYHGYMDYLPNPQTGIFDYYFVYSLPDLTEYRIRVVYKDGTAKEVDPSQDLDGYRFEVKDDQREVLWGLGTHSFTLSYLGAELEIPVEVIQNPVVSVEAVSPVTLIENMGGHWDEAYGENGAYSYYYYYFSYDIPVRVNYRDGSSKLANVTDQLDGEWFECYADQYSQHWKKDTKNVINGTYMGVKFEIPVEIVENPVQSITIDSVPDRVYVYGDPMWGYMNENGYRLNHDDLTGLKFTVNMKDGTKKTYTYADIDEEDYVDGYPLEIAFNRLVKLGENTVTLNYLGKTAEYKITVVASPYASVEVVTPLPYTSVSGKCMPYFDGLVLRLTKKDSTVETVTVTKENVSLRADGEGYIIRGENGLELMISVASFDEEQNTVTFRVYCHDQYCDLSPLKVEKDIYIAKALENVSIRTLEGGGAVKVTWDDGTSETVTLKPDPEVLGEGEDWASLLYQTEEGYLQVDVSILLTEDGEVFSYRLYFPFWNDHSGLSLIPSSGGGSAESGDLDGNGAVTSSDAIYLLYHALFGNDRYPVNGVCDYDKDGKVTSSDAIYLLYHALFGADRYPL